MTKTEYSDYLQDCETLGVTPCEFDQWQFAIALAPEFHLPYLSPMGNLWTHDTRKKTTRTDRPLAASLAMAKDE